MSACFDTNGTVIKAHEGYKVTKSREYIAMGGSELLLYERGHKQPSFHYKYNYDDPINHLKYSRDEALLATCSKLYVRLYEQEGLQSFRAFSELDNRNHVSWNPTKTEYLACSGDGSDSTMNESVLIFNIALGAYACVFRTYYATCVEYAPHDSNVLASTNVLGDTILWDVRKRKKAGFVGPNQNAPLLTVAWSSSGTYLAHGDQYGSSKVWDLRNTTEPIRTFQKPSTVAPWVVHLEWYRDKKLLECRNSQTVRVLSM